ncbi:hypothetical protein MASR2M17_22210 [Aminivibrio sp.]
MRRNKEDIFERCLKECAFHSRTEERDLQKYSGKILLRMPRSLHKSVAEAADDEEQSINTYIIGALRKLQKERDRQRNTRHCMLPSGKNPSACSVQPLVNGIL